MDNPFPLFRQFEKRLRMGLCSRADGIRSDAELRKAMGVEKSASLKQVHGKRALVLRGSTEREKEGDGLATDLPGLLLSVRAADCQTFLVYEPERHVLAMMHVGWKGLMAGMIPSLYALLREEWGIIPAETYVAAGPSLCQVHAEFTAPDVELPEIAPEFIDGRNVDLRGEADLQLQELGVEQDHIDRHPDCTKCHPERFFSYRGGDAEKVREGTANVLAGMLLPL